jgi:hypothetical protein
MATIARGQPSRASAWHIGRMSGQWRAARAIGTIIQTAHHAHHANAVHCRLPIKRFNDLTIKQFNNLTI